MDTPKIINFIWQGPFSIQEAISEFSDSKKDYGLYQIYGTHSVNGTDNLLYIGKSEQNIFKYRLTSHQKDWIDMEVNEIKIFIGRVCGTNELREKKWSEYVKEWDSLIDIAEKMLIYHTQPCYNVREKFIVPKFGEQEYIILNFGKRFRLPAEISTYFLKNHRNIEEMKAQIWEYIEPA